MTVPYARMPDGATIPPPPPDFVLQAESLGLSFDSGDIDRFRHYLALLLDENTRFNLTAVRDPAEAWTRHVLDSLALLAPLADVIEGAAPGESGAGPAGREPGPARIVDVGSGGGAPGLILAIALPDARFTLVEATGKKARFLERAAEALGLRNVIVAAERAETLAAEGAEFRGAVYRGRFDAATARAVGRLAETLELTIPFLRVGGVALLTKGQRTEEELAEARQALHMLHCGVAGVIETPTGKIVAVEKRRPTPRAYPRRPGEPKKAPLGVGPRSALENDADAE